MYVSISGRTIVSSIFWWSHNAKELEIQKDWFDKVIPLFGRVHGTSIIQFNSDLSLYSHPKERLYFTLPPSSGMISVDVRLRISYYLDPSRYKPSPLIPEVRTVKRLVVAYGFGFMYFVRIILGAIFSLSIAKAACIPRHRKRPKFDQRRPKLLQNILNEQREHCYYLLSQREGGCKGITSENGLQPYVFA